MDIVDIILAKALTPQCSVETYAALAEKAVADASKAVTDAEKAIDDAEDAIEKADAASDLVEQYADILANFEERVDSEISDLYIDKTTTNFTGGSQIDLTLHYPDGDFSTISAVTKYYNSTGNNTNGTMTQKAITDAINAIEPGGDIHFDPSDAGKFVIIDNTGTLIPYEGSTPPVPPQPASDIPYIGWTIDYTDSSFTPFAIANGHNYANKNGALPVEYLPYLPMYKRLRCTVADDGTITSWQGQNSYTEDGSMGQVMVYQPKFYYLRIPIVVEQTAEGEQVIRKETIIISSYSSIDTYQLKIHPVFINGSHTLEYVLLPAFEGCAYKVASSSYVTNDASEVNFTTDKLSSIANVKPISGVNNNLTINNSKSLAANRGTGWNISTIEAESANQMLFMMEFASFNGQNTIERGICDLTKVSNTNYSSQTGSTTNTGIYGQTNAASATTNITNGNTVIYTIEGTRAIQYRGMENPWGNMWRYIDHVHIIKKGGENCATIEIYNNLTDNYRTLDFKLSSSSDWISGFGYSTMADWLFIPTEATNANSLIPIGDKTWIPSAPASYIMGIGGAASHGDSCGLFYYSCDRQDTIAGTSYGARLFYQPSGEESSYESNYTAWQTYTQ